MSKVKESITINIGIEFNGNSNRFNMISWRGKRLCVWLIPERSEMKTNKFNIVILSALVRPNCIKKILYLYIL